MNRFVGWTSALWLAAACSETGLNGEKAPEVVPQPDILLDPPDLVFGELSDGEEEIQTFTVTNIGDAGLDVSDIIIGNGIAFEVLGPDFEFTLASGEDRTVDVRFTPMGADENYGAVAVLSNDPDSPEAFVNLLGFGLVPELQITPSSHNFSDAFIPCGVSQEIELKNVGDVDLIIDDFTYRSGGSLRIIDEAAAHSQLRGLTLEPGDATTIWVEFTPTTSAADTGVLEVSSNDPRGIVTADQNGEGAFLATNTETFTTPGIPPVDVIVTIDQSCSMEDDNVDDVQNGFPGFIAELQNVADWQLILVTEGDGCATGGVLDSNTPNAETLLVNNAFPPGNPDYTTTEALLKLTDRALSKTGPGGCNEGFLRPGALLHAVTLSDESEQSGQSGAYWVGQLENYVTDPNLLKISGVLDLNRNCGDGSGPGGYEEAVDLTGGSKLNICNANWGAQFTDIASDILAGLNVYNLTDPADAETIEVLVNGVVTTDIEYVEATQSLTINSPSIGDGDTVTVNYNILATCSN
jgi:hypothetical protein